MKKKFALPILVILLLCVVAAALGEGLNAHELWQQSLEKMNTVYPIRSSDDGTQAELPLDEALAIARQAIIDKYGTPESELDAMGVYPAYFPRGWDGKTDEYPSNWDILFSSRTGVHLLEEDTEDYGPYGQYGVYINAETREVTFCHWYTSEFWAQAQRIWDCGSYDVVYTQYGRPAFRSLPQEEQARWTELLAGQGYEVIPEEETLHRLLRAAATNLQFCDMMDCADPADPQVIAAWEALETQLGFDAAMLQKYAYVATRPAWQTGTDNVCIHYSHNKETAMMDAGYLDNMSAYIYGYANHFGLYMVSFEPGTTEVAAITHVTRSENVQKSAVTSGPLLSRTDWTAEDLPAFDEAFRTLDRAVQRMRAAGLEVDEIRPIVSAWLETLGGAHYADAPEDMEQWFTEESEWDAYASSPAMTFDAYAALYGPDVRLWPMEVMVILDPRHYRMPHEGETTIEEATAYGMEIIVQEKGQEALDELARLSPMGEYTVVCLRISLTSDPDAVDCRWEVFVTADPLHPTEGYRVHWGEWADHTSEPQVQDITDYSNG